MKKLPQGRLADTQASGLIKLFDNLMQGNVSLTLNQLKDEGLVRIKPRALRMALAARIKTADLTPFAMPDNRCSNPH